MEAYLDNAATTKVSDRVAEIVKKTMSVDYGNPSSKHNKGFDAEQYVKAATNIIADSLKVQPKEIIFTSGGTESNNMALIGAALANKRKGNHIISSGFEHASVYNPLLSLEDFGFKIDFAPVDEKGHIKTEELLKLISDETIIVSIMYVNNEVGAVQNIAGLSKAIKAKKNDLIFHVDAIQAYGKYRIFPKKEGIDMLSVSGHKINGPKGSGFLYVDEKVKVRPLIFGGGQQKNRRSGTENVPAIAGIGEAVKEFYENHEEKINRLYDLKKHMLERIPEVPGTHVNAASLDSLREAAPHIVSVSFDKIKSEVLLHALEEKGICVSSGSACSSNHPGISSTLTAIGVKKELLDSTLRFSFSVNTTIEEIDYCIDTLKELVPIYSRFSRR
ncbi:MAG: cysteine desulfurase [Lachnospiraceae bacterium]|nr:cysteine desulfurase [Lachnospiraceae bacterium]